MSYKSIITIGRQYGSGGREIGEELAKLMGVPFYDRELIALAAEKSGVSPDVYAHIDETATNSLLYALSTGAYMFSNHFTTISDLPLNDKLYIIQNNIINEIIKQGSCVIVGRCADYILRDNPDLISVFIHAPLEKRVERIAEKEKLTPQNAETRIVKTDKKRANYYNFYTNRTWGDITNYDIAVDSTVFGPHGTAELLLEYVKRVENS